MKNRLQELEKLDELLKKGILTEEEFKVEKERILNAPSYSTTNRLLGLSENTYGFLIHITVFLGFVHPVLGLMVPVVLWAINRDNFSSIDWHGKHVISWMLSVITYMFLLFIIAIPLNRFFHLSLNVSFNIRAPFSLFSGFFPISILMVLSVIFVIIGAIKASRGEVWRYPLSINFFGKMPYSQNHL